LPDHNEDLIIGALEQSTNNNLYDFLTSSAVTSDDSLQESFIAGEDENISVLPFQNDIDKKSSSNGIHFISSILI